MKLDLASFKMEYEAARDRHLSIDFRLETVPKWVPTELHATYLLGYGRGLVKAMQFDPISDVDPPIELEWHFKGTWQGGYKDGCFIGTVFRGSILNKLMSEHGLKSLLFGPPRNPRYSRTGPHL